MAREASPEVISFRSLFLPQGPLITLVGGTGGQWGGGWWDAGESLHVLWRSEYPWELCVCVLVRHDGGECLLAILLQQFKRCVKNTWIINPICTRHVWVCVRECETQNAFERCDWKCCSASSVWMWVYSCVYMHNSSLSVLRASTPVIYGALQINTTECIRAACVCALKTAQSASAWLGVC